MKNRKFIFIALLLSIAGGLLGYGFAYFGLFKGIGESLNNISNLFLEKGQLIYYSYNIISFVTSIILILIGRKSIRKKFARDEEIIEENLMSFGVTISTVTAFVNVPLFVNIIRALITSENFHTSAVIIALGVYFLSLFYSIFISKISIDFVKSYRPETYDNILDLKYRKKQIAGMDEREQLVFYKAAYKSFSTLNNAMYVLSIILSCLAFDGTLSLGYSLLLALLLAIGSFAQNIFLIKEENVKKF